MVNFFIVGKIASVLISKWAKKSIDKLMTSEPRTYRDILDDLFALKTIEHHIIKNNGKNYLPPSRTFDMPTIQQMRWYLSRTYPKIYISRITNKPVKGSYVVPDAAVN